MADAASFALAAVWLWQLRALPVVGAGRARRWRADFGEGWTAFIGRRWLVAVVVQFAGLNVCLAGFSVVGPLVAQRRLGGALGWSVILAAEAAGLLVGSLLALRLSPRRPQFSAVLATFGFVPPFVLLALGAPLPAVAGCALLGGVCGDLFEVLWTTAVQAHVPAEVLSRISAFEAFGAFVVGPPAIAVAGPLATAFGPESVLAAGAVLMSCGRPPTGRAPTGRPPTGRMQRSRSSCTPPGSPLRPVPASRESDTRLDLGVLSENGQLGPGCGRRARARMTVPRHRTPLAR
jgi:hypothetical protein